MAQKAIGVNVSAVLNNGSLSLGTPGAGVGASPASAAAVAAAVATLVADAASPTQAHVTTLDSAWTTLSSAIGSQVQLSNDVVIQYNASTVTSRNTLRAAIEHLMAQLPLTL